MLRSGSQLRTAVVVIAGLVLAGAVASCGSSTRSASSAVGRNEGVAAGGVAPAVAAPGALAPAAPGAVPGAKDAPAPTLPADQLRRSIVYTGSITVRVSDVDAAASAATSLASGTGGYVSGDQRSIDASRSAATMILRVPAARFESTLTALGTLGTETGRHVSTDDVTEQVIDVQSRLKTQQASVDRIRALLAQATTIASIVSIESELTRREADLESMEAQLRSLSDLTSLSTITVTLLGPDAKVVPKPKPKSSGFVGGLKAGWHTFLDSLKVLLTVVGAILPFAIVIGVPVLAVGWFARRRRSRPALSTIATTRTEPSATESSAIAEPEPPASQS